MGTGCGDCVMRFIFKSSFLRFAFAVFSTVSGVSFVLSADAACINRFHLAYSFGYVCLNADISAFLVGDDGSGFFLAIVQLGIPLTLMHTSPVTQGGPAGPKGGTHGSGVGDGVGCGDSGAVGAAVGDRVGTDVGFGVGTDVGANVGAIVGVAVGVNVGGFVEADVGASVVLNPCCTVGETI